MGFRSLRVINDDTIQPEGGFGTHGHDNMEIVTYVLTGALQHRDSLDNGSTLRAGDVQRMTAGHGIRHSEFNASATETLRLIQIWLLPEQQGLEPGYEEKMFPPVEKQGRLCRIVSPDGRDGSLSIHQDVSIYASLLDSDQQTAHELAPDRHAWIQVASGSIKVNDVELGPGDGAAISEETVLNLTGSEGPAEFLLFDLT